MNVLLKIRKYWLCRTTKGYIQWLREQGVVIGKNFIPFSHNSIRMDTSSPGLIEIGDNVSITADVSILTHDFCSSVFRNKYFDYIPARQKVKIGNNVYIGQKAIILRGVTIGDNVIIGAGSVVAKDIPSDSVAAGVPAKVICQLDEYYQKRKSKEIEEAKAYARHLYQLREKRPIPQDFREEFALFWHEEQMPKDFVEFIKYMQLPGELYDKFVEKNVSTYASFDDFIDDAIKDD